MRIAFVDHKLNLVDGGGANLSLHVLASRLVVLGQTASDPESPARFVLFAVSGGLVYLAALAMWAVIFRWDPRKLLKIMGTAQTHGGAEAIRAEGSA